MNVDPKPPRPMRVPPLAVNINDAADALGVSRWIIQRAIKQGHLKPREIYPGGPKRIPWSQLEELTTTNE